MIGRGALWSLAHKIGGGVVSDIESQSDRLVEGAKVRREVLGEAYVDSGQQSSDAFSDAFQKFTVEHCWGNVWLRPGLSRKTRSMLNLSMLSVMGRWHEFETHVRGAINNGVSDEEIIEIILQAGVYAGIPVAAEGLRRARAVVEACR